MPKLKPLKIHPDRKKKRVMAKVLYNGGWGSKQIALWFKAKQGTVQTWVKKPTPEQLKEFEQNFMAVMRDYDMQSLAKVKLRMNELIPQEENLEKLIKAGEFFRGDKLITKNQTNTQVNVYGDLLKKYSTKKQEETEVVNLIDSNSKLDGQ